MSKVYFHRFHCISQQIINDEWLIARLQCVTMLDIINGPLGVYVEDLFRKKCPKANAACARAECECNLTRRNPSYSCCSCEHRELQWLLDSTSGNSTLLKKVAEVLDTLNNQCRKADVVASKEARKAVCVFSLWLFHPLGI